MSARQLATAITRGILFMSAAVGVIAVGVGTHIATDSDTLSSVVAFMWGAACIAGYVLPELAYGRDSKPRK